MKITAELLEKYGAYCDELWEFRTRFPSGIDTETVDPGDLAGFDLGWFAEVALYKSPWDEFKQARKAMWDEFLVARDVAYAEYLRTGRAVWSEFKRTRKAVWAQYERSCAEAIIRIVNEYGLKPPSQEMES